MYFRNYGLRKTWLDKSLKNPVSEEPLTGNVVNGPKHSSISTRAPLTYSLITAKLIELERVSLSDIKRLNTVS